MVIKSAVITLLVAAAVGAVASGMKPNYEGTRAGHTDADYINSRKCIDCHAGHYASWARTYHSRMTQEARAGSVQGDFETDNTFEYEGTTARMEHRNGSFFMTFTFPGGRVESNRIVRTVGSRRIEQYITEQNGQHTRLPIAYDLTNRRWMNLNGSFFYPDGKDYSHLSASWDPNCVFCHNVKAQPNLDLKSRLFNTEVGELGIACGACHGPAARHADEAASPFTRSAWRVSAGASKEIVNPRKLDAERSLMVCGHCHGQRIPAQLDGIQQIMSQGDPYNSGDDLARFYQPVWRDTKVGEYSFANRFWANGSPRLTAYEYQGILRSACFIKGDRQNRITCLTCHSMHEGDPKGQIMPENRTNKPCLACHQEYETAAQLTKHTGHRAISEGSMCYNCHMPRVVYGVMSVHPTHEITVPDPRLTSSLLVPNACNQCHLDRSVNWAVTESKRLWPTRFAQALASLDPQFDLPEGPRALFAGDALTRALMAEALAGGGPVRPDASWASAWLVEALQDNYAIVRFFAAGGLTMAGTATIRPDYMNPRDCREAQDLFGSMFETTVRRKTAILAEMLRAKRSDIDIEVGE